MSTNPCKRPTWKLGVAFAGMCVLAFCQRYRELSQHDLRGMGMAIEVAYAGAGVCIAWWVVFRTSIMQVLWGWVYLVAGVAALGFAILDWLGIGVSSKGMPAELFLMPVIGWLLVIDPDVVRHRRHVKRLEDEARRLRFEQQDLENERRRLGLENQNL